MHPAPRKPARLDPKLSVDEGLRAALLGELDIALEECRRLASWEQAERRGAVHELRRALKRFRAGASLCAEAVDAAAVRAVQEAVRSTAERLSAQRDRDVLVDTIAQVARIFPKPSQRSVRAITTALVAPEKATTAIADWQSASEQLEESLTALRQRMVTVDMRAVGPDSVATSVARRWRRVRRRANSKAIAANLEQLHEVRKDCQRLSLQLQLLAPLGPRRQVRALSAELGQVVSMLGEDRDLALLEERLRERHREFPDPRQAESMMLHIRSRRAKLLRRARKTARRTLAMKAGGIRRLLSTGRAAQRPTRKTG
ncbi:MAG: CHAD domain-containing protein [Phycisphaerae bacterium]|nr:CHAD domain-containing protein [Phycisphaerae bacterium]